MIERMRSFITECGCNTFDITCAVSRHPQLNVYDPRNNIAKVPFVGADSSPIAPYHRRKMTSYGTCRQKGALPNQLQYMTLLSYCISIATSVPLPVSTTMASRRERKTLKDEERFSKWIDTPSTKKPYWKLNQT